MIGEMIVPKLSYGEAVLDHAISRRAFPGLCSLDDFLLDVTSRKERRDPTMMDLLVAEALREPGPTRRWFLKAGLSIGAVAFLSVFPGAPVSAAGATFFVSPTGDNSDGLTWAKGKTTITAGIAVCGAGDYLLVDSTYAVSAGAAVTWTPPAGGLAIISVTPSGASGYSAFTAGAAESVGAANSAFALVGVNLCSVYLYGLTITGGTNNNSACTVSFLNTDAVDAKVEMEACSISLPSIHVSAILNLGAGSSTGIKGISIKIKNSTITFASKASGAFTFRAAEIEIINPTLVFGATKVSPLFSSIAQASTTNRVTIRDGDISSYTGTALIGANTLDASSLLLENLKISATPALTTGTWGQGNGSITLRNVDSGDTINTFSYINSFGTLTVDTSIYVTAGKQFNGAGISWKIVTSSLATEFKPFVTPALFVWDTTTSAQTAAIEIVRDNATLLTNRDIWSDLDSAASASFPNYTYQTNRNAQPFVGTAADQPTSTVAWTGISGFTDQTKQKLENTFTAAEVGTLQARVSVAVASTTLYVAPYIGGVT